jgi:exosortase/archaeosortase family protein
MIAPPSRANRVVGAPRRWRALLFLLAALMLFGPVAFPHAAGSRMAELIGRYVVAVAKASAWLIRRFEGGVFATETGLIVGRYALQIVLDCAALDVHALYLAATLVFPCSVCRKVCAALFGSVMIASCNLLRIAALYFVGLHAPERFDFLHEDLLALLMVLVAAVVFYLLLVRAVPAARVVGVEPT